MKYFTIVTITAVLLTLHACQRPDVSVNTPTNAQASRVSAQLKINWTDWIVKGMSWHTNNLDGSVTCIMPLKFVGKTIPAEVRKKAISFKETQEDALVYMLTTVKGESVLDTRYLIDLPDELKPKVLYSSKKGRLTQQVCTDHYYQVCSGGQCAQPVFTYRDCASVDAPDEVSNNPGIVEGAGDGSGGGNDGMSYGNTSNAKHDYNEQFVFGKIQCRSFPFRSIPGNSTKYETATSNLVLHFSNNTIARFNDVYISVPTTASNGAVLKPNQMAIVVAQAADAAANACLTQYRVVGKSLYMGYLQHYTALLLDVNESQVDVRTWTSADGSRGLNPVSATYVTPYMRWEPCNDNQP